MDIAHVKLQHDRLERHFLSALREKDSISFLDLAHTLRVWGEMKNFVDEIATERGIELGLTNRQRTPESAKKTLRGSKFFYLPIASGVEAEGLQVKGLRVISRALTSEEVQKLFKLGPPVAQRTNPKFSDWMGACIYEARPTDEAEPFISISREILIKRVANTMGGSHPEGAENAEENEKKFDPYIRDLHEVWVADGYRATHYQLLEIAGEIVEKAKCLFAV